MTNGNGEEIVSESRLEPDSTEVSSDVSQLKYPSKAPAKAPEFSSYRNDAEQLADIAASVTAEMTEVLVRLELILKDFKETVATSGYTADHLLGQSLGGILSAVEEVRMQMESISAHALAMSSARLAHMAEAIRLDMRQILASRQR